MTQVKTIILVHGFWADASCYSEIIPPLLAEGYRVIAVQNPLTSFADDVAATKRALNRIEGDCILVGHSWGGFVITEVGHDARVSGLVYLAALAPDAGESMMDLMSQYGTPSPHFQAQDGFVWITQAGVDDVLASDLPAARRTLIHATQTPPSVSLTETKAGNPAWKTKPSWYLLTTRDQAVPLELQRDLSQRMRAEISTIESSHFPMISHPEKVLDVIRKAASGGSD